MIYPVPDPRYSFLGIHLTRNISDEVHVGPNAVFALALEGYRRRDIDFNDLRLMLSWPGTWRLVRRNWQHGSSELLSSLSKTLYVRQVRRYLADIETSDLISPSSGVRAQAVDRSGNLVDDFVLQEEGRILLVRNAPSPAATSSLAIAEYVVSLSSKP
jgi:L-2-hydroxyglutarate oxidase LhgO